MLSSHCIVLFSGCGPGSGCYIPVALWRLLRALSVCNLVLGAGCGWRLYGKKGDKKILPRRNVRVVHIKKTSIKIITFP
jgi:hypothetical protein